MSLFDLSTFRLPRAVSLVFAGGLLLTVAACGWQPLYAPGVTGGASASTALNSIDIPEANNRLGQLIRNNLLSNFKSAGDGGTPLYTLELVPTVTKNDVLVQIDTDVRRVQYQLGVTYKLIDLATRQPVNEGHSFSIVSYTRVASEYANIRAEKNASEKTARAVAEDIRTRLAAFFSAR